MSRRYRKKRNQAAKASQKPAASMLELAVYLMLCFQIASTAIYYNGIMHPLIHKMLLGQTMALAAWFFYGLYGIAAGRFTLRKSPYYLPLLVLCAWAGIRSFTAPNADALWNYWIFLNIVCTFPLWVTCFRSPRFRNLFAWTVVFCGVVLIIGCLRQLLTDEPKFNWPFFKAITLSGGTYDRQWLGSFMGHNNDSTAYIAIALIYTIYMWYLFRSKITAVIFAVILALGFLFIFLGGSRGVALMVVSAALVLIGGWFLRTKKRSFKLEMPQFEITQRQKTYGGAFLIVMFLLIIGVSFGVYKSGSGNIQKKNIQGVISRFLSPPEHLVSGTYPRVWLMSLLMARENPVTGVGFSAWPHQYPQYQKAWFTKYPDTRIGLPIVGQHTMRGHNDFLQLWAELGLIGLICLLWLLWIHFRSTITVLKKPNLAPIALFTLAATLATLTRAIFAFPFHMAAASCLFIANVGLISSIVCKKEWVWEPAWLSNDWNAKLGYSGIVLAAFLGLNYPNWVMISADFSALRYTSYVNTHAVNAYNQGDMESYRYFLDEGYRAMKHSLETIPDQGNYLHEYGSGLVVRGLSSNDNETLLKAVDYLKKAQRSYGFYGIHENLGKAYRRLWENTLNSDYLEAGLEEFREASSIMPTCATAWIQEGLLLAKSGEDQACIDLMSNTALRFSAFIERDLLNAARLENRVEDQTVLYNLAASIVPSSTDVLNNVLGFYLDLQRMDLAIQSFVHMAPYQPEKERLNWMTTLLKTQLDNGLVHGSMDMMSHMRRNPEFDSVADIWYYSGAVDWIGGNTWGAVSDWSVALQKGVPLEQIEPPFSVYLNHMMLPMNLR